MKETQQTDQDLFFAPIRKQMHPLYFNKGNGTFEKSTLVVDVNDTVKLFDIDNDGDQDVFVTNRITGEHGLWFNQLTENKKE